MSFLAVQFLTGLASASSLFLVACGLSIIFGVTRIVNFAHGSLYMLGAYIAFTLTAALMPALGGAGFWLGVLGAALAVGTLGIAMEVLLLRRIYRAPELLQLLATFGVVLVVQDVTLAVWGPQDRLGPRAPGLSGSVAILGARLPEYDLALIVIGPLVLGALWLVFQRTRWGILVRAATQDREMTAALGVNQKWLFTSVVFLGAVLAGFGGALQLPREPVNLGMDLGIIVQAFVVVVVGGLGSILGAFLAALLIAELAAFGILLFPQITLVLLFLVMAVVLVLRPQGLLGRMEATHERGPAIPEPPLQPPGRTTYALAVLALAVLILLPTVASTFTLVVATEVLIFALFAASLQFLMGIGGMISFGHAAYFGLGAYGAALLVAHLSWPMAGALAAAPLVAAMGALVFGWFCVRLSGVYMAMLTLAFAQIAWSVAFQWQAFTGGDNGILGVWPSEWASEPTAFYYLTLVLVALAVLALRQIVFAPFGYAVRAARDSPLRAEAIGIDLHRQRWLGFTIAGIFAGLSGGLYAFLKGSVFPDVISIPMSVDALVMVLLGGVQTLSGPLMGAAVYTGLKAELVTQTTLWRGIVGLVIIGLVLAFPRGLAGAARQAWESAR